MGTLFLHGELAIRCEKQYMEEVKLKEAEKLKDDNVKQTPTVGGADQSEKIEKTLKGSTSKSPSAEQDLDTFLLGDLEDSDGGPGMFVFHFTFLHVLKFENPL